MVWKESKQNRSDSLWNFDAGGMARDMEGWPVCAQVYGSRQFGERNY